MTFFRNFSSPLWQLFAGKLLLLFCSIFYLAWWIISFRPDSTGEGRPVGTFCIAAALITGITAIALMAFSITSLSGNSKSIPVYYILAGGAVLFFILLPVTSLIFHRQVTSELIIIFIWTIVELSALAVLHGIKRFNTGSSIVIAVLIAIAFILGLVCYMLYYNLDKRASYFTGMIPLITDAIVMTVFLIRLVFS